MNITKNYHGRKIVMLLYCYFNIIFLISCQREVCSLDEYTVHISNKYFENIDSISIDSRKKFDEVSVNGIAILPYLKPGEHRVNLYTHSKLVLGFKMTLAGDKGDLHVYVNEQGNICWQ